MRLQALGIALMLAFASNAHAAQWNAYLGVGATSWKRSMTVWQSPGYPSTARNTAPEITVGATYYPIPYLGIDASLFYSGDATANTSFEDLVDPPDTYKGEAGYFWNHCSYSNDVCGAPRYGRTSAYVYGGTLALEPTLPITSWLSIYAKIGLLRQRMIEHVQIFADAGHRILLGSETTRGQDTTRFHGLGVRLWRFQFEADRYNHINAGMDGSYLGVTSYTVSYRWKF